MKKRKKPRTRKPSISIRGEVYARIAGVLKPGESMVQLVERIVTEALERDAEIWRMARENDEARETKEQP